MPQAQLPAHLQNRQIKSLTDRAAEGMGSSLPPHISIQGNSFTFIDAAGTEYQPILTFDAVVVDVSDVMCKRYFDKPWDPSSSTYDPPACWSANGIAPSKEATKPQAAACATCPQNERGSKISALSGASIKACRDERWIALLVPQMLSMIFQLVITPGSFKNWKAYTETLRNFGKELSLGLTRFSFKPKVNGELLFEDVGWVDAATADVIEAAVREKKTDVIVGRNDRPRETGAQIGGPVAQATLPPPNQFQQHLPPADVLIADLTKGAQQQVQPGPFVPAAAAPQPTPLAAFPTVAGPVVEQPAAPVEAPRRRRRTQAEIAAANAPAPLAAAPNAFVPQTAPSAAGPAAAPQVPFPVAQPAASQPAPAPQFGMAPGMQVNPEMAAMLAQLGFVKPA